MSEGYEPVHGLAQAFSASRASCASGAAFSGGGATGVSWRDWAPDSLPPLPRSIEELRARGGDLPGNPIDLFREG